MRRRRMIWKIFPSFLLVTILTIAGVMLYVDHEFRRFYSARTIEALTARARLFEGCLEHGDAGSDRSRIDALCKELGARTATRITVIRPDGVVVGDTDHDPATMDNHSDRPEVREALRGEVGSQLRRSDTLDQNMMYVAVPLRSKGSDVAVIRTAISLGSFESTLRVIHSRVVLGGVLALTVAGVLCWLVARRITRPLEELRRGVAQFGRGGLDQRLRVPDSDEIGAVAQAMNEMAASLDARLKTIGEQRHEMEAVFDAMAEGVLVVDLDERVLHLNRSAEKILGVTLAFAKKRFVQEVARNPDLQSFVRSTLASDAPVEGDVAWRAGEERHFQARGTSLRNASGVKTGSLIVLNEVTRLYRLERVRRDFVANVSHEMQTPITSIYGYAETLMDKDSRTDELTEKAAQAIVRQAGRLSLLVDDLLELSRIEKQAEAKEIPLSRGSIREVLESAIETCGTASEDRGVPIRLECPEDIQADINPELLERALVNLLDNATKYSERGKQVDLSCEATPGEVIIRVRDEGCGVAREHLPRLFERFYRVDKARSRSLGGTGLGLAIVKHIVLAHRGTVAVESEVGKGSLFTIVVPRSSGGN